MTGSNYLVRCTLALVFCLTLSGWAAAETSNRVVAVVNNEIITWLDLEKALKTLVPPGVDYTNPELQKQVLLQLIDQKLLELQIKKQGFQAAKEEVDAALNRIREEQGLTGEEDFKNALAKQAITEVELRKRLADQILRYRLVNREIGSKLIFSEARIREYYQSHPEKFSGGEKVKLAQIVFFKREGQSPDGAKAAAEAIRERLLRGEDFDQLVREVSRDAQAAQGGELGIFEPGELDPELRQAVAALQPGQVGPVQPAPEGWRLIKLIDREKTETLTLEQARGRIQDILYQEEMETRYREWMKVLRDRSSIQILL